MSLTDVRTGSKSSTHMSLYKAVVVDSNYNLKQGLIKVIIKELSDTEIVARPVLYGKSLFIPEEGSIVLVYADSNMPNEIYYIGVLPLIDERSEMSNITNISSNVEELKDREYKQEEYHVNFRTPYISDYWKSNSVNDCLKNKDNIIIRKIDELPKKDSRITKIRKYLSEINVDNSSVNAKVEIVPATGENKIIETKEVSESACKELINMQANGNDIKIYYDCVSGVVLIQVNSSFIRCESDKIVLYGGSGKLAGVVTEETTCYFNGMKHKSSSNVFVTTD